MVPAEHRRHDKCLVELRDEGHITRCESERALLTKWSLLSGFNRRKLLAVSVPQVFAEWWQNQTYFQCISIVSLNLIWISFSKALDLVCHSDYILNYEYTACQFSSLSEPLEIQASLRRLTTTLPPVVGTSVKQTVVLELGRSQESQEVPKAAGNS